MRNKILSEIAAHRLPDLAALYSIDEGSLRLLDGHEGCQNLVYSYTSFGEERVLRISFRDDRDRSQIEGELEFILHLREGGVSVAYPIASSGGRFVETLDLDTRPVHCVSFIRARGSRLSDMGYKYREGVPLTRYFEDFGAALGKMHRLSHSFMPSESSRRRPDWIDSIEARIREYMPPNLGNTRKAFESLLEETKRLAKDESRYGLTHGDFGDGNFMIDYETGEITPFDFDDCRYNWYIYDLADAWTKGFGWAQFESSVEKRKDVMANWFDHVLKGYSSEREPDSSALDRLPFFLKLVEMDNFLDELRYRTLSGEGLEPDEELGYTIRCIDEGIPYFGFFEQIYSTEHPFVLDEGDCRS